MHRLDALKFLFDDVQRVFAGGEGASRRDAVPRRRHEVVLHGEHPLGIHAQEGIAPDLLAAFDAFQQERRRADLRQLEIDRNRRFQVGQQGPVDRHEIALFKQAVNGRAVGDNRECGCVMWLGQKPSVTLLSGILTRNKNPRSVKDEKGKFPWCHLG